MAGALLTGTLSDRWGRRRMLRLLCAAPVLMLFFLFGPKALALPLLIALGLTAISPTPVMMAIVQDQFPDHRAAANGVYMFINFLLRALALWLVGALADRYGLTAAFTVAALAAFAAIPAVLRLPLSPRLGAR